MRARLHKHFNLAGDEYKYTSTYALVDVGIFRVFHTAHSILSLLTIRKLPDCVLSKLQIYLGPCHLPPPLRPTSRTHTQPPTASRPCSLGGGGAHRASQPGLSPAPCSAPNLPSLRAQACRTAHPNESCAASPAAHRTTAHKQPTGTGTTSDDTATVPVLVHVHLCMYWKMGIQRLFARAGWSKSNR